MASSSVFSIRVNEKDEQILTQMAEATDVSKSKLVAEAIHHYIEMNEWHRKVVAERIQMADRGEFATKERINTLYAKYGAAQS